ncbi:questin oxidase family protein [Streptomyces sp. H27-C3]|uniref:questin oxidase family protein n=1 Tax=Streptomyces sp. H27-C3 TaxID=3046305 RepID=UPI0024BAC22C|nr:questin oxidase family protein [Streptomyces sp. H27-C3]MDJ0463834.1 questin oxidase family protein [Streptomyces sp. H27-C3]
MNIDVLDEVYERLHSAGPEFGGDEEGNHGLTNHGPMTAEVLARRGYADLVPSWVDRYMPRLTEMPRAGEPIRDTGWQEALGRGERVGDWAAYFGRLVAERPWADVLTEWWPRLLPGIGAGATHGVIRVGHAVRALTNGAVSDSTRAELAHGLAFWAARSLPIPGATAPAGDLNAALALAGLPHLQEQSGLLAGRLGRLTGVPGWSDAQAALRPAVSDEQAVTLLRQLVDAATLRYLTHGHGSPVLLVHTATAPNAVLHVLPTLPRQMWAPSFAAVWSASAALVSTYEPRHGIPRGELPEPPNCDDPIAEVVRRSAEHGDEHVIKFTDTAVEVFERTGNPDALAAATHIATLVEPT